MLNKFIKISLILIALLFVQTARAQITSTKAQQIYDDKEDKVTPGQFKNSTDSKSSYENVKLIIREYDRMNKKNKVYNLKNIKITNILDQRVKADLKLTQ